MMYRNKKWFALIPLFVIAAALFFGWIVTLLWNAILVPAAGAGDDLRSMDGGIAESKKLEEIKLHGRLVRLD